MLFLEFPETLDCRDLHIPLDRKGLRVLPFLFAEWPSLVDDGRISEQYTGLIHACKRAGVDVIGAKQGDPFAQQFIESFSVYFLHDLSHDPSPSGIPSGVMSCSGLTGTSSFCCLIFASA